MKILIFIVVIVLISKFNAANSIKIKDVCAWHHKEIIGWHESYKLFSKRYIEVSDKTKYPNISDKTIKKNLLKQKKLLKAINNAEKKLQSVSKIYHYLECTRFEKKLEKTK